MLKSLLFCFSFFAFAFVSGEQTLSILKPDAVAGNHVGEILTRFERNGLKITALKMIRWNEKQAAEFYAVHKERPFFSGLVKFMSSGPIVALVLEGDNAVVKNRELMGATDPVKAVPGTIRKDFAASVTQNAVHGSDSAESAKKEIALIFKPDEIFTR